jgi:hypothetical protein
MKEPHATSPTHGKVITASKSRPSATCVPVVNIMFPTSHVRIAYVQIWATPTLAEVKGILPEEPVAINRSVTTRRLVTTCTANVPSVSCLGTSVPEKHTSMATTLKHLNSRQAPTMQMPSCLSIAPTMTAIIVDGVPIVNP